MPRSKTVLVNLNSGSLMINRGKYIYNGTDLNSIIPKGSIVIGSPWYKRQYAEIKVETGGRSYIVKRSDLQKYEKQTPEKYLVTKNSNVKEIFACNEADAKETARKILGMQRLTKVQVTKVGAFSGWSMFMPGVKVRVVCGDYLGKELLIKYMYYKGCFLCTDMERSYLIYEENLERI